MKERKKISNVSVAYKSGYLPVSHNHSLYYELHGNPLGKPVLYLHGGPGSGFTAKDTRFFNSKVYNIILFDQRGAGRSKPFASLYQNTTQHLVKDITILLNHLHIQKTIVFGGSWGSTLALVFSILHPKMVSALVVSGIFLANKDDIAFYTNGVVRYFFPDVWERFISFAPQKERKNIVDYYLKQMTSKDEKTKEKYAYEWTLYELSLLKLKSWTEKQIKKNLKDFSYKSLAPLEAYYIKNNCFIEEDFILKNAHILSSIPTTIVHGRYDFVCPAINAFKLHEKIKGSNLHIVISGHSRSDKALEKKLKETMQKLY